jgi:putative nucleotidyltransferase with HDIG domain
VRVAVLAEKAAVAVGANALLARVMSLYHDVGKISAPLSFRENQNGDNPHDRFAPEESADVLRAHVDEGLALAREHHLPSAVAAVIAEHHADSLMDGFFDKAKQRAQQAGLAHSVDERAFRYTGQPPQTKESAIVMLADQIESVARSLDPDDVTAQRLGAVVDHFVNRALTTDLLASCDLSLKELERARAALKTALQELMRSRTPSTDPRRGET